MKLSIYPQSKLPHRMEGIISIAISKVATERFLFHPNCHRKTISMFSSPYADIPADISTYGSLLPSLSHSPNLAYSQLFPSPSKSKLNCMNS